MLMSYNLAVEECGKAIHLKPDFQLAENNLKWGADELQKSKQAIALQEQSAPAARDANFYLTEGAEFPPHRQL